MKYPVIIGMVAAMGVTGASAETGDAAAGKALWDGSQTQCRSCHGAKGEGGFGPPLAGRGLSAAEFRHAARMPWGLMPAYAGEQVSDRDLADFAAYFAGLPRVETPAPWRVPLVADSPIGQKTAASLGCAQCHGATFDVARGILGGTATGFAEFKDLVYDHVAAMPRMGIAEGNTPGRRLHMGNYNPLRISEQQLKTIYDWTKDDLGFRPFMEARLTSVGGADYVLTVANSGFKGRGPAAEDFTVTIRLPEGVTVVRAGGEGWRGAAADGAVWHLAAFAPEEERRFTLTLSKPVAAGALKGSLSWARPKPKTGAALDRMNFVLR
jgi:mono/diheme cytochrome c family protein